MDYIIVLGGGESGLWSALLAKQQGARVLLSDSGTLLPEARDLLIKNDVPYEEGGHTLPDLKHATAVIKSPGIPDTAPVVRRCEEAGIPILSEPEYAARFVGDSTLIGITGSNGKTTTTTLTAYLLRACGLDAIACGNIGTSLARCVASDPHRYYVIELSSFQLDHMYHTRLHVAALLNVTPDHLDRYEHSLDKYADAKWRVFQNQTPGDLHILNLDDPISRQLVERSPALHSQELTFSVEDESATAYYRDGVLHFLLNNGSTAAIDYSRMQLKGEHNAANVMAACLVLRALGADQSLSDGTVQKALDHFAGIPHRMEPAGVWRGITFINDSKATNIDATHYALGAMKDHRTILILGGTDKGNDYTQILPLVQQKCKTLIYLTTDSQKLHTAFDTLPIPAYDVRSMAEAFGILDRIETEEGDTFLLSPACASFDLFHNYEHRGDCFKAEAKKRTGN